MKRQESRGPPRLASIVLQNTGNKSISLQFIYKCNEGMVIPRSSTGNPSTRTNESKKSLFHLGNKYALKLAISIPRTRRLLLPCSYAAFHTGHHLESCEVYRGVGSCESAFPRGQSRDRIRIRAHCKTRLSMLAKAILQTCIVK